MVHVKAEERDGHEHEEDDDAGNDENQFFHSGKNTTRGETANRCFTQRKSLGVTTKACR
jgi:hypothetical protein